MKKKILVTGGAGYIGSFIARELTSGGFEPVIIDNLSSGHEKAVADFRLEKIDLVSEKEKLDNLLKKEKFTGVIHMASFIQMGESFTNPGKYFHNNLLAAINLLNSMVENKLRYIVFSSSAGVYGNPKRLPIKEDDPKNPENPYGETKIMIERVLYWYDQAHGLKSVSIRYFNAAGAAFDGSVGEDHPNESHIIPLLMKAALTHGKFTVFGNDYDTPDGTCVRDYVHVIDLAKAHTLALEALMRGAKSNIYNAGIGRGYSNLQIIRQIEKVVGSFDWKFGPRRKGDADNLYADISKIKRELGWRPKYGLTEIIKSAYTWHKKNPRGYETFS